MISKTILFNGQGSRKLFSCETACALENATANSITASKLVSECHVAFLEDISSLDNDTRNILGLNPDKFSNISSILHPPEEYHKNGVLQATTLCLYQLLQYIANIECSASSDFTTSFDQILETSGFCAGLIPAIVVAASKDDIQYLDFAVAAFRLAFWIGSRATLRSLNHGRAGDASWSLVVNGIHVEYLEKLLKSSIPNGTSRLCISAISSPDIISVSGPPSSLISLRHQLCGDYPTKFAYIHAWYHGGDQLDDVVLQVANDMKHRAIKFPSISDLKKPIRSPLDGSFLDSKSECIQLVTWVAKHLLVHCVSWKLTFETLMRETYRTLNSSADVIIQIQAYGPGSDFLLWESQSPKSHERLRKINMSFPKLRDASTDTFQKDAIAIVGMGFNLPKIKGHAQLLDMLSKGLSAVELIPENRFIVSNYYSEDTIANARSMHAQHGAFVDDMWSFDNAFFSISPREAKSMDPQQRLLLHATQIALDDAGYLQDSTPSFQRSTMGCYMGVATGDYTDNLRDNIDVFYSTGNLRAFHSGRISYVYKLSGPCMTLDTACSSSMISIYNACRALQSGDCKAALAGGVNTISSPDMFLGLDRGHFLSKTGGCKSFDSSADGYTRAEGCVVFVLKRLSDATAENDRIHGIIRDVVVNQSGNARSITHPHSNTQVNLFKDLLQRTGVNPSSLNVVEAHGTGTSAGDTSEIASLMEVFRDHHTDANPLIVSSIKGNIGHTEAASGAAGLVKLLLMLRHKLIFKQASLRNLNPNIKELREPSIQIPLQTTKWRKLGDTPRRAILNNFGAAGSNGALLLEEYVAKPDNNTDIQSAYSFILSAKTRNALQDSIRAHLEFLDQDKTLSLKDICYTATARRQLYNYRIAFPCYSIDDLKQLLHRVDTAEIKPAESSKPVIFVFSGQGGIYRGMGNELMQTSAIFRQHIMICDSIMRNLGFTGLFSFFSKKKESLSEGAEAVIVEQCACVALEFALAQMFMSWNIIPDCIIGHSLGEYAALAITGALSIESTMQAVALRAKLMTSHCTLAASGMLASKASPEEADKILIANELLRHVSVACRNSRTDCVLAGPLEELARVEQIFFEKGYKCKKLPVPYGYHSSAMDPLLEPLRKLGALLEWKEPLIPIFSTVLGHQTTRLDLTQDYLAAHARQPVLFEKAVHNMITKRDLTSAVFLEIGPHPTTLPMLQSIPSLTSCQFITSLQKGKTAWDTLSTFLCLLVLSMDNINWRYVFASSQGKMIDLPGYQLCGTSFKVEYQEKGPSDIVESPLDSFNNTGSQLLPRMKVSDDGLIFQTTTDLIGPLIMGHNVGGTAICPASAYLFLAIESAQCGSTPFKDEILLVKEMRCHHPLIYYSGQATMNIRVFLSRERADGRLDFRITFEQPESSKETMCCSGVVLKARSQHLRSYWVKEAALIRRQGHYLLGEDRFLTNRFKTRILYENIFSRVVRYSQEYQSLIEFSVSETSLEGIGTFRLPISAGIATQSGISIRWFDVLFHAAGYIANLVVSADEVCICVFAESIEALYSDIDWTGLFTIYCSLVDDTKGVFLADSYAVDSSGKVVAMIKGMEFKKMRLSLFQNMLNSQTTNSRLGTDFAKSKEEATAVYSPPAKKITPSLDITSSENDPIAIICDVSGLQRSMLSMNSSLESLGLDSMMLIEIAFRVKKAFPMSDISQNSLSECDTLQAFVDAVNQAISGTFSDSFAATPSSVSEESQSTAAEPISKPKSIANSQPNLIRLQKVVKGGTPLVLFHDGSGTVDQYSKIKRLHCDVLAFQSNMFSPSLPFESLQKMASAYASQLSPTETPSLIIGGWSFGGIVAFQIANELVRAGIEVRGLILIDSPYPVNHVPLPEEVIRFITHSQSNDPSNAIRKEFRHNSSLLGKYKPLDTIKQIKTVVLMSEDTLDTSALCGVEYGWLSSQPARLNALADWEHLLGVQIKVLPIPGNHFEAFSPRNLNALSTQLQTACQYIESE